MKNNITRYGAMVITILFLGIALSLFYQQQSQASDIPDTPEEREVIAVLERAVELFDIPFEQLDLKQLAEVLMNDPSYEKQLSAEELAELKEYTRKVQGEAALQDFGYLTTMRTKRINQQHGANLLRAAQEKAKAENREITKEEMQQLTAQNYGMEPYIPEQDIQKQKVPFERVLTYLSIKLDEDTAEVSFDDMVKNRRATLLRVNGRWYVSGIY